ncbi:MAG: ABC transporter ATP-binding protein [Cyanobacteria bacterium J06627_32]
MNPIEVLDLSKRFRRYDASRPNSIMAAMLSGWKQLRPAEYFWALRHISFTVAEGEMVGIVGNNGAGKSTLLKLLGKVGRPDRGSLLLQGRVGALLDLGAGFHADLTGRENVLINGVVAGLLTREVKRRFEEIVEFAEVGRFIDNPIRTYSTGMRMRLAFSVAVHTQPDILLVDEHLAVGDHAFQDKCLDHIAHMKAQGCTIVLVSHSTEQIEKICDRAIWLEHGYMRAEGVAASVVEQYLSSQVPAETRSDDCASDDDAANEQTALSNRMRSLTTVNASPTQMP